MEFVWFILAGETPKRVSPDKIEGCRLPFEPRTVAEEDLPNVPNWEATRPTHLIGHGC